MVYSTATVPMNPAGEPPLTGEQTALKRISSTPRALSLLAHGVCRGITYSSCEGRAASARTAPDRRGRPIAPIRDRALFGSGLGLDSHVTRSVGAFVLWSSEYRTPHRAGRCGRFPQDPRP
jgi:hypothetical protein